VSQVNPILWITMNHWKSKKSRKMIRSTIETTNSELVRDMVIDSITIDPIIGTTIEIEAASIMNTETNTKPETNFKKKSRT
jgi:hypothetical protein